MKTGFLSGFNSVLGIYKSFTYAQIFAAEQSVAKLPEVPVALN